MLNSRDPLLWGIVDALQCKNLQDFDLGKKIDPPTTHSKTPLLLVGWLVGWLGRCVGGWLGVFTFSK